MRRLPSQPILATDRAGSGIVRPHTRVGALGWKSVTLLHMSDSDSSAERGAAASRLDLFGAAAAFLCAAHCLCVPVLLALSPWAGFEALNSHVFDVALVAFALTLGGYAIARGVRRHRQAK